MMLGIHPWNHLLTIGILALASLGASERPEVQLLGKPISTWESELRSDNPQVRRAALQQLKALSPGIHLLIPLLSEAVQDADHVVRLLAVQSLTALAQRYEEAIPPLIDATSQSRVKIRLEALKALRLIYQRRVRGHGGPYKPLPEEIYVAFVSRFEDPSPEIRAEAVSALDALTYFTKKEQLPDIVDLSGSLVALLSDEDTGVRAAAAKALESHPGPSVKAALEKVLEDPEPAVRHRAAISLCNMSRYYGPAVRGAAEALSSESAEVVLAATMAIWRSQTYLTSDALSSPELLADRQLVMDGLLDVLKNGPPEVRASAANRLGELGAKSPDVVHALMDQLRKEPRNDPMNLAQTISTMGDAALPVTRELVLIMSRSDRPPAEVARIVGNIGYRARDAVVDALVSPLAQGETRQLRLINLVQRFDATAKEWVAQALEEATRNPSPAVRLEAVKALRGLGPRGGKSAAAVAPLLNDGDPSVRRAAAGALTTLPSKAPEVRPSLEKAAEDPDPQVRMQAEAALRKMQIRSGDPLEVFLKTLQEEEDPSVRSAAVRSIVERKDLAREAIPAVLRLLEFADPTLERDLLYFLMRLQASAYPAVPGLVKILIDREPARRGGIASTLASIGAGVLEPMPSVVAALEHPDSDVKRRIAVLLRNTRTGRVWATDALVKVLEDPDRDVRIETALTLVQFRRGLEAARPVILDAAIGPGEWSPLVRIPGQLPEKTREILLRALNAFNRTEPPAVEEAGRLLKSPHAPFRLWAIRELGRAGRDAAASAPELIRLMDSDNEDVRTAATEEVSKLGAEPSVVLPLLRDRLADTNFKVRAAAATGLGTLGPEAIACLPDLINALDDPMHAVMEAATDALGQMGVAARPALDRMLEESLRKEGTGNVNRAAASALWLLDPQGGTILPALFKAMEDEETKEPASRALQLIGPDARPSVPLLVEQLQHDDPEVRKVAATCLGKIGPGARSAVPDLVEALRDPFLHVAHEAREALKKIGYTN